MTQLEAAALVERQRRRWHSQASDIAIARRAERGFMFLAGMNALFLLVEAIWAAWDKRTVLFVFAAGFLVQALFLFWHSRRFTQAMFLLGQAENFEQERA